MEAARPSNCGYGPQFLLHWGKAPVQQVPENLGFDDSAANSVVGESAGVVDLAPKVIGMIAYLPVLCTQRLAVGWRDCPEVSLAFVKPDVNHIRKVFHGCVCSACGMYI